MHDRNPFASSVSQWVDWLVSSCNDLGLDAFIFWPSSEGKEEEQVRIFAEQVVPKVGRPWKRVDNPHCTDGSSLHRLAW